MITQEHYNRTTFCKNWAATPQQAVEKLREQIKQDEARLKTAKDEQDYENLQDDIQVAKNDLKELQATI